MRIHARLDPLRAGNHVLGDERDRDDQSGHESAARQIVAAHEQVDRDESRDRQHQASEHRRDRLLIGFWWLAGLRVGQTLGLRHDDIDARKAQLRIVPRANPNGARPKVRETQTVPLRPEILELYGEYVREELQSVESDYVFVNLWCEPLGSPMTYSAVDGLVRRLRAHSGENFTPHQLRHTFATDLHREGVSLEVISRLLTHRSISTTSDLYLHLDVEDLRAGLEMAKRARS